MAAILRVDGNTVAPVEGYRVAEGYRSLSSEGLTVDELGLGIRKAFGAAPSGLGD